MSSEYCCSILLVDTEQDYQGSLAGIIESAGHKVEMASCGLDALVACQDKNYDLVVLDLVLSDLSGLDLISRLENIRPDLDVLIVTDLPFSDLSTQAVSRSTIGYLVKPIDPERLLDLVTNVAQRRQMEAERQQLIEELEGKNAELERFSYTMSHDLKNPLLTIKGFLGMIQQDIKKGQTKRLAEDLQRVSDAANHMDQLLDELLLMSRIGRTGESMEEVPLSSVAMEVVELVSRSLGDLSVYITVDPNLPVVQGDRVRLQEVFQNLLENAVKFFGDELRPQIEIGVDHRDGIQVCYVRDNGIGIDRRYHTKVFGLFDQLEPERSGSGIGLALVKRIIECHGGRVWVESEGRGAGSRFCFTLPAIVTEQTEHPVRPLSMADQFDMVH